ncbi:MAG: hypothetical protein DHS20C15_23320 [Planctomycetota bacterium]|nr:MAG: hypothetical protein DHS20C15_23320 [Planctomycetota bacterium]
MPRMPHTLAHPAAVLPLLPLLRNQLPLSALVVGSVAPDLAYFLPLNVGRSESHSSAGLLWFCLPVGALAYAAFHVWVAPLIADLSPRAWRARLPQRWSSALLPSVSSWRVLCALLLGALTHVSWDAFTHAGDPGVRAFPWLGEPLLRVGGFPLRPYKLLQHGGSVVGALAIAFALRRGWRRGAREDHERERHQLSEAGMPLLRPSSKLRATLAALVFLPPLAIVLRALWQASFEQAGFVRGLDHVFTVASFDGGTALLGMSLAVGASWRVLRSNR